MKSIEYKRYQQGAKPAWTPIRFPGQYEDAETGLFENWNRFYDPVTGQYTAPDPILPGGAHLDGVYAYAGSNPHAFRDPTGMKFEFVEQPTKGGGLSDAQKAVLKACASEDADVRSQCNGIMNLDNVVQVVVDQPDIQKELVDALVAQREIPPGHFVGAGTVNMETLAGYAFDSSVSR